MNVRILGANALVLLAAHSSFVEAAAQEAERGDAAAWRTLESNAKVGAKVTNTSAGASARSASGR